MNDDELEDSDDGDRPLTRDELRASAKRSLALTTELSTDASSAAVQALAASGVGLEGTIHHAQQ